MNQRLQSFCIDVILEILCKYFHNNKGGGDKGKVSPINTQYQPLVPSGGLKDFEVTNRLSVCIIGLSKVGVSRFICHYLLGGILYII